MPSPPRLVVLSSEVFDSFVLLHVDNVLWFELMRGGVGMPKLEVHDKQSAWAEIKLRLRTSPPRQVTVTGTVTRSARHCECESAKGTYFVEVGRPCCVAGSAKILVM